MWWSPAREARTLNVTERLGGRISEFVHADRPGQVEVAVMWTNDLWAIGLTGAMVGGALGWPLVRGMGRTAGGAAERRMLGALFLLGSIAVALIATAHSGRMPPMAAVSVEHVVSAGDLVFWSLLTVWVRRVTGLSTSTQAMVNGVGVPLLAYALLAVALNGPPPFVWLLPVSASGAAYAVSRCVRSGAYRGDTNGERLFTRVVAFSVALFVAQAIRTFWPHVAALREIVPLTMTAGFVSIASLAMRWVFIDQSADAALAVEPEPRPYARSALDETAARRLMGDLDDRMARERWYCDRDLSLRSLAERLQTTPHAVSQALNQIDGRSLHEYLTAWRVAEARRQLLDPASAVITIDAVAEHAGFGSRSAFYKAFKAHEGMTPTECRRQHVRSRTQE
jgi:AraC-like DNA-binding protein